MILRTLFGTTAKKNPIPEERLPALHSFIDISVAGRATRSVPVEDLTARSIVVGEVLGRTGERGAFVYETFAGKFRFGSNIIDVRNGTTAFALPSKVESVAGAAQKRSSMRLDTLIAGSWRFAPGGNPVGEFMRANVRDISRGGCALITNRECKVGQMLEVRLDLRSAQAPLTVLAEVMRVSQVPTSGKFSHGLRFHALQRDGDEAIVEFINTRLAELRGRGLA